MVYVEKTPRYYPDFVTNVTEYDRQSLREERRRCCRLANGLTMYDLYDMPKEDFERLEQDFPGATYMHPFCLAEILGTNLCKKYNPTVNLAAHDDDDEESLIVDWFISIVAKNQNKTILEIEGDIEPCTVSGISIDEVKIKMVASLPIC